MGDSAGMCSNMRRIQRWRWWLVTLLGLIIIAHGNDEVDASVSNDQLKETPDKMEEPPWTIFQAQKTPPWTQPEPPQTIQLSVNAKKVHKTNRPKIIRLKEIDEQQELKKLKTKQTELESKIVGLQKQVRKQTQHQRKEIDEQEELKKLETKQTELESKIVNNNNKRQKKSKRINKFDKFMKEVSIIEEAKTDKTLPPMVVPVVPLSHDDHKAAHRVGVDDTLGPLLYPGSRRKVTNLKMRVDDPKIEAAQAKQKMVAEQQKEDEWNKQMKDKEQKIKKWKAKMMNSENKINSMKDKVAGQVATPKQHDSSKKVMVAVTGDHALRDAGKAKKSGHEQHWATSPNIIDE